MPEADNRLHSDIIVAGKLSSTIQKLNNLHKCVVDETVRMPVHKENSLQVSYVSSCMHEQQKRLVCCTSDLKKP